MFRKLKFLIITLIVIAFSAQVAKAKIDDYKDVIFFKDDKVETIALHKGQFILMEFWATWCPYCKQQLPAFSLLKDRYKENPNVKLIALSTDEGGYKQVEAYYKENNFKNLEIYHDKDKNLFRALGIRGVPTILLISKEGNIMKVYNGMKYLDIDYLDNLFK